MTETSAPNTEDIQPETYIKVRHTKKPVKNVKN